MRELKIGMAVVFVDENRKKNTALVTCIHGNPFGGVCEHAEGEGEPKLILGTEGTSWPCVNLLIVSRNPGCQDQYGRQIERSSSVVYQAQSSAQGFCYHFLDEKLDPSQRQPSLS